MLSRDGFRLGPEPGSDGADGPSPGGDYAQAPIGMLLLDQPYAPGPPGTPDNFSPSKFPVSCRIVEGCTLDRLVCDGDDGLEESMVAAARKLVDEGARAITGNCGFMIRHQAAVSNALDVPVLLSGLLLAPLLLACMGGGSKLGIVTASAASLSPELLGRAGVTDLERVVVGGLEDQPAFRAGYLDFDAQPDRPAVEKETVGVAGALVEKHPDIAAVLFECTALPPYAPAVQRSVGVPVFDNTRLVDLVAAGFATPAAQRLVEDGRGVAWLSAAS